MVIAVLLVEVDSINSLRRSLIAFLFFRTNGNATERDAVSFKRRAIAQECEPPRGLLHEDAIGLGVWGQGMKIEMGADQNSQREQAKKDNIEKQHFHNRLQRSGGLTTALYIISIGRRARGSRSFVVAVLGEVTNGPPSSGALSENATSGISLGKPSSGNSFRSGK